MTLFEETFYAVKVEGITKSEYWEVVPAVSEEIARRAVNDTFAEYGGTATEVRPATQEEIDDYYLWQDVGGGA